PLIFVGQPGGELCQGCAAGGAVTGGTLAVTLQEAIRRREESKKKTEESWSSRGSITFWNRLEPRPRSPGSVRDTLAARVRDPVWMLTRQWQMGEFRGEDAGSPANVRIATKTKSRAERGTDRTSQGSENK